VLFRSQLDTAKANQILDGILPNKGADGFRTLPDGSPLDIEIGVVPEQFVDWPSIAQLVVEDWAEVGIKAHIQLRERTLHFTMRTTNELMAEMWNEDTTGFPFSGQPKFDPRSDPALTFAPLYGKWYTSDGAEGIEPPELGQLFGGGVGGLVARRGAAERRPVAGRLAPAGQVFVGEQLRTAALTGCGAGYSGENPDGQDHWPASNR